MNDDNNKPDSNTGSSEAFGGSAFMLVLQLAIFVPFLGPLVAILLGVLNRHKAHGQQLMLAGLGFLLLHGAVLLILLSILRARGAQ